MQGQVPMEARLRKEKLLVAERSSLLHSYCSLTPGRIQAGLRRRLATCTSRGPIWTRLAGEEET